MENIFDFAFPSDNSEQIVQQTATNNGVQIDSFQIIRLVRRQSGSYSRNIIDTIKVEGDTERARERAVGKAQRIGNCFVIEKSESLVATF